MRLLILLCCVLLIVSCKKTISNRKYTIEGQILESSSHSVPVANYRLKIYQPQERGLITYISGIDTTIVTDNSGKFSITYTAELLNGVANSNFFTIQGLDTTRYNFYPEYFHITPQKDTNLNTLFLYKEISLLIRKVKFNNPLNIGDTLEVITTDAEGAKYKNLYGAISAGTTITADTILNYRAARFDVRSKSYPEFSTLRKPSYQTDFPLPLAIGDEHSREIMLTY